MKKLLLFCAMFLSTSLFAAVDTSAVATHSYAGVNVTTSAYVEFVASTPFYTSRIQVCDTSTKIVKFASGTAGNEKDLFTVQVSGCVVLPYIIPAGTRLSAKAVDASATTGYNTIAFFP